MPFMGEHDWSTEWSSAKDARPNHLKCKTHASMPHLGQVLKPVPRPATYADEVNSLRHPPRSPPKRSQSLDYPTMAEQKEAKHVHFVDEGYGSTASSPATSPKQEPASDEDDSRSSSSDSDFEQLASQPEPSAATKKEAQPQPTKQQRVITLDISCVPLRSAKQTVQAQTQPQRASRPPVPAARKSSPKRSAAQKQAQAAATRTGGSYRNNNGNICFEEFSYFGGF